MDSPIITLTTDWGPSDFFVGMAKGRLYSDIPNVRVVDITHGLEPFQLSRAIFVTRYACMGFPEGTIHIIDATASNDKRPYIVVRHKDQYFICVDNGLPCAIFGEDASHAVAIDVSRFEKRSSQTFAAYDIFCPVAAMLASGAELSDIGAPLDGFLPYMPICPIFRNEVLKIYVSYIDNYGNAILNITYKEFKDIQAGREFEMNVHGYLITKVVDSYSDANTSGSGRTSLLLTVSTTGYLQIALRQYSAEQYFGLREQDALTVHFKTPSK